MSKSLTETQISSRAARKKLDARQAAYWRAIDPDVHIGYRKRKSGGHWVVRWRNGSGYKYQTLGVADDEIAEGTLDFESAIRAARAVVIEERRLTRLAADGPIQTVMSAVEKYIERRDARDTGRKGRQVKSDARSRLELYVIGRPASGKRKAVAAHSLAGVELHALEKRDLAEWRDGLPDDWRSATKQRLINDLKAALNDALAADHGGSLAAVSSIISHGLRSIEPDDGDDEETIARDDQILTDSEVARLILAAREVDAEGGWEGDLHRLVHVLASTGARFSQVTRIKVGDVQIDSSRIIVPASRKGKGSKNFHATIQVHADLIELLKPILRDRAANEPLLERWHKQRVAGGIRWERSHRGAWKSASDMDRAWAKLRIKAGLPHAIAYALRYSSIVRNIRFDIPIRIVAAKHDTSVVMIERHYARFITDGVDEIAGRAVVSFSM